MAGPERTVLFVYNSGIMARLVGRGKLKGQNWTLGAGTFTIGRDETNNLSLGNEAGVSKVHCKVTLEDGKYTLVDAESRNGTLLNGKPIQRAVLKNGDEVRICNVVLGFEAHTLGEDDETGPKTASRAETTERVTLAQRKAAQKAAGGSSWPYVLLGMVLFFGAAGGGAFYAGLLDEFLPPTGGTAKPDLPRDVPPPKPVDPPTATGPTGTKTPPPPTPPAPTPTPAPTPAPTPTPTPAPTPTPSPEKIVDVTGKLRFVAPADGGRVEVKHTLNARVHEIVAKQGTGVHRGQVLLTYDDLEAGRRLGTAREIYNQLKEVAAQQDTDRARKALADAKADLERAQAATSALRLVAPADGTVADVFAEQGKRGGRGNVAVVMATGGGAPAWTVTFTVSSAIAGKLSNGAAVLVVIGDKSLPATVDKSLHAAGLTTVTASLTREPAGGRDGMEVKVKIP